jgi:hypothetical protein
MKYEVHTTVQAIVNETWYVEAPEGVDKHDLLDALDANGQFISEATIEENNREINKFFPVPL